MVELPDDKCRILTDESGARRFTAPTKKQTSMKFIASILAVVTLLAGFAFSETAAKTKYVVGMTGVT